MPVTLLAFQNIQNLGFGAFAREPQASDQVRDLRLEVMDPDTLHERVRHCYNDDLQHRCRTDVYGGIGIEIKTGLTRVPVLSLAR